MAAFSNPTFIAALKRVPLFSELDEIELASIALTLSASLYDADQNIFTEGDRGGDLLIVMKGSVKVLKLAANGRQQLLSIEREGSTLGEVSVFDSGPYSATAVALEPTVLLRFQGIEFRAVCLARPELALKVIRVLGHRLRHLRNLVEQLSFATVRDRLIAHLLQLATESGATIVLHENNEELAGRLGTVRELVSRNLGRLHSEGLIVMRRRSVVIPDLVRLRAELSQ